VETTVQPTPKPAPSSDNASVKSIGTHNVEAPVYIHESVLEEILDYSHSDMHHEVGGFLLGDLYSDCTRPYIEVNKFCPAEEAKSRAASFTFTHETWAAVHREIDEEHPDLRIVGWHHTHPGFGIFLSGYDLFIHRNYFGEWWQVAMVVDPQQQEMAIFQWTGDEIEPHGFICVSE